MKTVIEAGHFYSVNGPSHASLKGWQIGKELAATLPNSELVLFVDDYHNEQDFLEPGDAFLSADEAMIAAEVMKQEAVHVFSEADIAKNAPTKVGELLDERAVRLKKGVVSVSGVRLGTMFDLKTETFKPTCVFLDYMLLSKKAELAPNQVTILPETYQKQQGSLAVVLGQLVVPGLTNYETQYYSLNSEVQP
jgi:hypothetical protein